MGSGRGIRAAVAVVRSATFLYCHRQGICFLLREGKFPRFEGRFDGGLAIDDDLVGGRGLAAARLDVPDDLLRILGARIVRGDDDPIGDLSREASHDGHD